jgi:hypothetical protein
LIKEVTIDTKPKQQQPVVVAESKQVSAVKKLELP